MNKKSLILGRSIFYIFVIVALGLIIVNEKKDDFLKIKAEKQMNGYIEENYSNLNLSKSKIFSNNNTFKIKLSQPTNKNHFFYIIYSNGKIRDTFKKDYLEGNSILSYTTEYIRKDIKKNTSYDCNVIPTNKLNKYNSIIRSKILKNKLYNTKYYYIQNEILVDNWTDDTINKEIINYITRIQRLNYTPKYYNITIIDKHDVSKSVKISNITNSYVNNSNSKSIINDIINNKKSDLLKKYNITYTYN